MASLMSLLTGHQPGAFEGFQLKDLFDKERWDKQPRTQSGQRTPTGPMDIRTTRGGEPMMTNWYKGREFTNPNRLDREMPTTPNTQANAKLFPLRPSPNVQAQKLSAHFRNPFRNPESVATRSDPMKTSYAPYGGEFRQDQMGGGSVAPPLDLATEEEVEAMNAYRNQMLTDLLAETSEEPEVKPISYYRKKKRSPKTWRSKSRGYRLKRV